MFKTCIIKLTSYCNLNCDYCYMFNLTDKTYSIVPKNISFKTIEKIIERIIDYLNIFDEKSFIICLHGGEPTLWHYDNFKNLFEIIRKVNDSGYKLEISLQTNLFVLPSVELLDLLIQNEIKIGISLDGPAQWNDSHRITHNNQGTYYRVIDNIEILINTGYKDLIGGFLCVANPEIPPHIFWEWIETLPVKNIDLLWPIEFNHDNPPWKNSNLITYQEEPIYGKWFSEVFDLWWRKDDLSIYIRFFYHTLKVILGDASNHVDALVNDSVNMFVVNTDGRIEYSDYLRSTSLGSVPTEFNIYKDSIIQLHQNPIFLKLFNLRNELPSECYTCKHQSVCGGGFLPGRTNSKTLLSNKPSILCRDQYYFFDKVKSYLTT